VKEQLKLTVPDELVEAIAERAAAIVVERFEDRVAKNGPRWLTLKQASKRLDCSEDAVRMRARRGRLKYRHHGSRMYVEAASVDDLG
jgi:DNA-directed RNA polymerase specialized sigma24 family protein